MNYALGIVAIVALWNSNFLQRQQEFFSFLSMPLARESGFLPLPNGIHP